MLFVGRQHDTPFLFIKNQYKLIDKQKKYIAIQL